MQSQILDEITASYGASHDFNGLPVNRLQSDHGWDDGELKEHLHILIESNEISLVFGDNHPNPHIKALPDEPKEQQLAKLENALTTQACGYPTNDHLAAVVDPATYAGQPYVLELALGEPQLAFRAFDLSVLEFYRNDPRYSYKTNDISGWISTNDGRSQPGSLPDRDRIYLQHFGFCYDEDLNRAVAVPIRYLANLTPDHQQMWKTKELSGPYQLHPDYDRQQRGEWAENISIFEAFIEELKLVNRMSELMSRPPCSGRHPKKSVPGNSPS